MIMGYYESKERERLQKIDLTTRQLQETADALAQTADKIEESIAKLKESNAKLKESNQLTHNAIDESKKAIDKMDREMTYNPLFWKDGETLTIRELRDILNSISDDDIDYENDEGQIWFLDRDSLFNAATEVERLNKNDIVLS